MLLRLTTGVNVKLPEPAGSILVAHLRQTPEMSNYEAEQHLLHMYCVNRFVIDVCNPERLKSERLEAFNQTSV